MCHWIGESSVISMDIEVADYLLTNTFAYLCYSMCILVLLFLSFQQKIVSHKKGTTNFYTKLRFQM